MSYSARKRKSFTISQKIDILALVDANLETRVQLASRLGISVSTLNTIVKNREEIEKGYSKCGSFSNQRKSLKFSRLTGLETTLAAWFKLERASNSAANGTRLKEMASQLAARHGIENFIASNGWIDRFKRRYGIEYKAIPTAGESSSTEKVEKRKENVVMNEIQSYAPWDIYSADETGLYYNLQPDETRTVQGEFCHDGSKSNDRITVLLVCNADGTDKLPPLAIGKYKNPQSLKNLLKLPAKYVDNDKSWMTNKIFEDFLKDFDSEMQAKNRRIVLLVNQSQVHQQDILPLKNIKVLFFPSDTNTHFQPLNLGIIQAFKWYYRKQLIQKIAALRVGGQLPNGTKLNVTIYDMLHFIAMAWHSLPSSIIRDCFSKSGFVVNLDQESSNTDGYLILNHNEEDDWKLVQPTGIQFEEYVACDSVLKTCDEQSVRLEEQITRCEEEELKEHVKDTLTPTFLAALQGLETARKYLSAFETSDSVMVMCSEIENELYRLRGTEKEQRTESDWIKKE